MSDVIVPPYPDWKALLEQSMKARPEIAAAVGAHEVLNARADVAECAQRYTDYLLRAASERGIRLVDAGDLPDNSQDAAVMAGHQPVVFHPGLLFKAQILSKFSRESGALGIQVIIDTDAGDLCEISWPRVSGDALLVRRASIACATVPSNQNVDAPVLYSAQQIKTRDEIHEIFSEMQTDLLAAGLDSAAERARKVGAVYELLAGCSLAMANSIARWSFERRGYREVPLSMLLRDTSLRHVVSKLAQDSTRLFETYNGCLDNYRREHSIKNVANPFPNLKKRDDSFELPFWVVRDGERQPLWSSDKDLVDFGEETYLATRGSITTMILRAYCSDLFIHGIGGGKYDRFVDSFGAHYLGTPLSPFVVASRTRVINPSRVDELSAAVLRGSSMKQVVSQTELYLGKGIFTAQEECRLREVLAKRARLREQLGTAASPEEKSTVAHALNQMNTEVREVVQGSILQSDVAELPRNQKLLEGWSYREFPYFLFEGD